MVLRCFSDEGDHTDTYFHSEPSLEKDYEILVVERVEWVPLEPLKRCFPQIKKKAQLHIYPMLPALRRLNEKHPFVYLVLADPRYIAADIRPLKDAGFVELRYQLAPLERIYTYLYASDAYLIHKRVEEVRQGEAVVPSAILMCLGVSTPIITSATEFAWFLEKEVMRYSTRDELCKLLIQTFEGDKIVDETLKSAEEYAIKYSPQRVAGKFLRLFAGLLGEEGR